jgi:hypothetical protein
MAKRNALNAVREQAAKGGSGFGRGSRNEAEDVLELGTGSLTETGEAEKGESFETSFLEKVDKVKTAISPMIDQLKQLGPEGNLIATIATGATTVADSWGQVGEVFKKTADQSSNWQERGAAVATAMSSTIGQVSQVMQAASQAKIAGIDQEIAAEKKRDGKSKESLARIKKLEAKKEAEKRKAFERNKKMQMAQIVIDTAGNIIESFPNWAQMAIAAVMGAAQLAVVAGTSYQGGGASTSGVSTPGSVKVGERKKSVDLARSRSASGELAYFRGAQGVGGPENFRGAFYGAKHRAYGGNTGYIVGEQGPELFMPDRPGTIVPADDTAAGMGTPINANININTIDASGVEEILQEQQGNIIGMLREVANAHGEDFMESVDEAAYTNPVVANRGGIGHRRKR